MGAGVVPAIKVIAGALFTKAAFLGFLKGILIDVRLGRIRRALRRR